MIYFFSVPSGNFGNLTAGLLAWRWGVPLKHFVAATNRNKIVPEYIKTGIYAPQPSIHTIANAMDVGDPSNFARMKVLFNEINIPMRDIIYGEWVTDSDIKSTIQDVFNKEKRYICPHTAAGVKAAQRVIKKTSYNQAVVLATAAAGKFSEVIESICGEKPLFPHQLEMFLDKMMCVRHISTDEQIVKDIICSFL